MRADLVDQVGSREWDDFDYKSFGEVFGYALGFGKPNGSLELISVGCGAVFFAVCGVLLDWRRSLGLLGILVVAVVFALGQASPVPVVAIMTAIPFLNTMGAYGSYASLVIVFCICTIAAIGFDRLRQLVAHGRQKQAGAAGLEADRLLVSFAAVTVAYSAAVAMLLYGALFSLPDFVTPRETFYQVSDQKLVGVIGRYRETPPDHLEANQYYNIRRGVGTITWYGNLVFPEHARAKVLVDASGASIPQEGYRGEVHCVDAPKGECRVGDLKLTYNTIRFRLSASEASTVVLNFNQHPGWSSQTGEVMSYEGLLAVRVPASTDEEIVLRFSDPRFVIGLWIALAAAALWCLGGVAYVQRKHSKA